MLDFVLDPSKENIIQPEWRPIETEIDFLRYDVEQSKLWIRGEHLCRWVSDVYRVRGLREGEHYQMLQSPRNRLQTLIGEKANDVDRETLERVLPLLNERQNMNLAELLTQLTSDNVWLGSPSAEHAAHWLLAEVISELHPFVTIQQQRWVRECVNPSLKPLYEVALDEREQHLKAWLCADDSNSLGIFPHKVEGNAAKLLIDEWGKQLRASEGIIIEHLSPLNLNAAHIAQAAYDYFSQRPEHLTENTIKRIGSHLSATQRSHLEELIPKSLPSPLTIDETVERVLEWAVAEYLPYRQWQVKAKQIADENNVEQLCSSFTDWVLNNYPQLSTASRETSRLNVRVKYAVEVLLKKSPVLWVVVDGLNYLNHQRLLCLLSQTDAELGVEEDSVLLAVLPTITEHAKYGLTSGMFPCERPSSVRSIKDTFSKAFPNGIYASSAQIDVLREALSNNNFRLAYWNMMDIDDCYHDQTDPNAARRNLDARLEALAQHISDLVKQSPHKERLAVVICTDHGQMIGHCVKASISTSDCKVHGRTAERNLLQTESIDGTFFVKDDNEEIAVLNSTSFRLAKPMTVALKNFYFGGWREDTQHRAWGVHGGLYPEEVVVGFSVLKHKLTRQAITAKICGSGEAKKNGSITLEIDNPNNAAITNLILIVDKIEDCKHGLPLSATVRTVSSEKINIDIKSFPSPSAGDELGVEGKLFYEFGDGVQHECDVIGKLTSKQMYSSQRPSLRDKFKK